MEDKKNFARLAGAGAALALGSTLLAGAPASAQAAAPVPIYQVKNANSSNSCLQVANIASNKGNVNLGNCDRRASQVWTVIDGVFTNPKYKHCLDGNGADVYTGLCNDGTYQKWNTTSGSPKSIVHDVSQEWLHANGAVGDEVVFRDTKETASRWVITQVGSINP
ncbi:RICIN domain-containing protein [Streptomyces sp. H27-C3]|uniref:RICIN domain-containing protein n=1 Tax=Streptomyces sp. H27-C3 TaxID=3046305 RepID=UPI0024B96836|nr:RICIN domain-containing protein [Streptomyces sp. H27-C3]MDJ0460550.1 RICIN domain-containing protein [Streptomyces sp. H27-C3]